MTSMGTLAAPAVFLIAGVLLYAIADGKGSELGRIMFFCGLFWLTYTLCGHSVHLP